MDIKTNIKNAVNDVILVGTLLVSTHLTITFQQNGDYYNKLWIHKAVSLLVGFVVYELIIRDLNLYLLKQLKVSDSTMLLVLYDVIKLSTVYGIKELILYRFFKNDPTGVVKDWMYVKGINIVGFIVYDVIFGVTPINIGGKYKIIVNDFVKLGLGDIFGGYAKKGTLDFDDLLNIGGTLIGLLVYHLVIKPIVSDDPTSGVSSYPDSLKKLSSLNN